MHVTWVSGLICIATTLFACSGDDEVSRSMGRTVERGPGTRLAIVDHAEFPWDRVCIFGPYTPIEEIVSVTATKDAAAAAQGIPGRDDINLLVFLDNGRVVRSTAHLRNRGDFGPEVVGKCYSRQRAVFVVRTPPQGSWGNIGPG